MLPPVHILATVRNPALLQGALLVFKTLRLGFPRSHVQVRGNHLETFAEQEVQRAARDAGAEYSNGQRVSHDAWIDNMLRWQDKPFWVCDTDLVFFECVENFPRDDTVFLLGRLEPDFAEEWTRAIHVERLHTCLMYCDPAQIRRLTRTWMGRFPSLWHTGEMNLVRQQFLPRKGLPPLFYDTCAGLWQAFGGTPFTQEQNRAFEHLHCATYADLVSPHLSLPDLAKLHKQIYADPQQARGIQNEQMKYYQSRRPNTMVVTEAGALVEKG